MTREELKPCPFCGGEAKITTDRTDGLFTGEVEIYHGLGCVNEECIAHNIWPPDNDSEINEITTAWNRRAHAAPRQEDRQWIADHLREFKDELSNEVGITVEAEKLLNAAIAELGRSADYA